jgi:hypothetical protein
VKNILNEQGNSDLRNYEFRPRKRKNERKTFERQERAPSVADA